MRVRPEQRFTRHHHCPVCGGYESMTRGERERCHGYISFDGTYAHCSREEFAGGIEMHANSKTFSHRLIGDCKCGVSHDERSPAVLLPDEKPTSLKKPGRIVRTYDYADEQEKLLFQVVRFEPKTFRQRRPDGDGGWVWNLEGVRRVPYGLSELRTTDPAELVLVLEGEEDVREAREMGFVATTNAGGAGTTRTP